ncbi:MAG: chemotaxis protein CheW [Sphingomonas sp.]
MSTGTETAGRAAELRAAFDRGFAEAPAEAREATPDYLRIAVGDGSYVVALAEVSAVLADKPIVAVPSLAPALLGVAAVRGAIVPVYSLRALLGHGGEDRPRWLLLAGGGVAFAFDRLEAHIAIADADIAPVQSAAAHGHVRANALLDGEPCPVVSIGSLTDELQKRLGTKSQS